MSSQQSFRFVFRRFTTTPTRLCTFPVSLPRQAPKPKCKRKSQKAKSKSYAIPVSKIFKVAIYIIMPCSLLQSTSYLTQLDSSRSKTMQICLSDSKQPCKNPSPRPNDSPVIPTNQIRTSAPSLQIHKVFSFFFFLPFPFPTELLRWLGPETQIQYGRGWGIPTS